MAAFNKDGTVDATCLLQTMDSLIVSTDVEEGLCAHNIRLIYKMNKGHESNKAHELTSRVMAANFPPIASHLGEVQRPCPTRGYHCDN